MILRQFGVRVSQCEQASKAFARSCHCPDCDSGITNPECDHGGFPQFEAYGFTVYAPNTTLDLEQIKKELFCRQSPIAFSWSTGTVTGASGPERVGHMAVIIGYNEDQLAVIDPLPLCLGDNGDPSDDIIYTPYEYYVNGGDEDADHWEDRYAISKEAH